MSLRGQTARPLTRRDLSEHLPQLRGALLQQRCFRVEQLTELAGATCPASASIPDQQRNHVMLLVRTAALGALVDIDAALNRMRLGCYGRCPSCGTAIELERLEVLPMVALCMSCQREIDEVDAFGSAAPLGPPARNAANSD